jgi:cation transport ATPase
MTNKRGRNLVCDQSSITGESKPIKKGKDDPFMISGIINIKIFT